MLERNFSACRFSPPGTSRSRTWPWLSEWGWSICQPSPFFFAWPCLRGLLCDWSAHGPKDRWVRLPLARFGSLLRQTFPHGPWYLKRGLGIYWRGMELLRFAHLDFFLETFLVVQFCLESSKESRLFGESMGLTSLFFTSMRRLIRFCQ